MLGLATSALSLAQMLPSAAADCLHTRHFQLVQVRPAQALASTHLNRVHLHAALVGLCQCCIAAVHAAGDAMAASAHGWQLRDERSAISGNHPLTVLTTRG